MINQQSGIDRTNAVVDSDGMFFEGHNEAAEECDHCQNRMQDCSGESQQEFILQYRQIFIPRDRCVLKCVDMCRCDPPKTDEIHSSSDTHGLHGCLVTIKKSMIKSTALNRPRSDVGGAMFDDDDGAGVDVDGSLGVWFTM